MAAGAEGQDGSVLGDSAGRGREGLRALAREVIVQHVADAIADAAPDADPAAADSLARHSVRQVREDRIAAYAKTVSKNAKAWLKDAARRLDERMKAAGYTEKVWHGHEGEDFNVFQFSANSHSVPAAYFTYNMGTAQNYAALRSFDVENLDKAKPNVRGYYVNPGKMLVLDEKEAGTNYQEFVDTIKKAYENGYDSVKVLNAFDDQGFRFNGDEILENVEYPDESHDVRTDILIVMQHDGENAASRIKAADPVTFMDEDYGGMPVPLDMRADQTFADLRFSVRMSREEYAKLSARVSENDARAYAAGIEPPRHGMAHTFDFGYAYERFSDGTFYATSRWRLDGKNGSIYWQRREEYENEIEAASRAAREDFESVRTGLRDGDAGVLWSADGASAMDDAGMAQRSVRQDGSIPAAGRDLQGGGDNPAADGSGRGAAGARYSVVVTPAEDAAYMDAANVSAFENGRPAVFPGAAGVQRFSVYGVQGAGRAGIGNADEAERMERGGATREDIWRTTGWWRGHDGKWRIDVDDEAFADEIAAALEYEWSDEDGKTGKPSIKDMIGSEDLKSESLDRLVKAYPKLADTTLSIMPDQFSLSGKGPKADYNPETNEIRVFENAAFRDGKYDARSVAFEIVHEIQHAIQTMEGHPNGRKVSDGGIMFVESARDRRKNLRDTIADYGEMEAYIAQRRHVAGQYERRNVPPWEMERMYLRSANRQFGFRLGPKDIRYSVNSSIDALSDIANGKEYGELHNAQFGTIRYPLGKTGKRGFGFLHIIEQRMAKEGATLDGAIDTAIRVGVSAQIGTETASPYNTHHLDYRGTRAIIGEMPDKTIVITGYEIDADDVAAANRRAAALAPHPHVRSEEVIRALKEKLASTSAILPYSGAEVNAENAESVMRH